MIHHFYHIYADGKWMEPVSEHVRALKMGLIDNLDTFHVGIVGSETNRQAVKDYLLNTQIEFFVCAEEATGWEQVTQIKMWSFCQDNEGLMLYAHSKGSSDPSDVNIRWRRSMTWHCVINWEFAMEKLKDHGAYGCHWIKPLLSMPEHKFGNFMMAGTFYWIHCDKLKGFMKPPLTHRWEAEGYIGYIWHDKPFDVYDPTPYFPNTGPFADAWVNDINFKADDTGKSYRVV